MGRTVPTSNQANAGLIRDLAKVREGLTTDEKKLWDDTGDILLLGPSHLERDRRHIQVPGFFQSRGVCRAGSVDSFFRRDHAPRGDNEAGESVPQMDTQPVREDAHADGARGHGGDVLCKAREEEGRLQGDRGSISEATEGRILGHEGEEAVSQLAGLPRFEF